MSRTSFATCRRHLCRRLPRQRRHPRQRRSLSRTTRDFRRRRHRGRLQAAAAVLCRYLSRTQSNPQLFGRGLPFSQMQIAWDHWSHYSCIWTKEEGHRWWKRWVLAPLTPRERPRNDAVQASDDLVQERREWLGSYHAARSNLRARRNIHHHHPEHLF